MRFKPPRISGTAAAASLGAGLAAALLWMLPAQRMAAGLAVGSTAVPSSMVTALAMGFLAPLPLMIAGLGFGPVAGLIALVVSGAAIGLVGIVPAGQAFFHVDKASGLDVLIFMVVFGVPAWLMSRLASLRFEPPGALEPADSRRRFRPEERVLGLIVAVAIGFGAVSAMLNLAVIVNANGGLAAFQDAFAKQVEVLLASKPPLPDGIDAHTLARTIIRVVMPLMAAAEVAVLLFNLWLAARIAQTSSLLTAPWPDIPRNLRVPRPLAIVFAVALGLSFAGGLPGLLSLIVSGALGMGFVLQGLAVIHALTRGKSFRFPLLVLVYISTLLMSGPIAFYALLGLIDAGFAFRDRRPRSLKPNPKNPT